MKIHLPNSVWIGNIDTFLKKMIGIVVEYMQDIDNKNSKD